MKLIVAVIQGDCGDLVHHLSENNFTVTEFSSIGAFFRRKSTTLLIGTETARVDEALAIIRRLASSAPNDDTHRATIFVLRADQLIAQ